VQSHGIVGVQARHYDGHDYMAEKRQALETLFKLLEKGSAAPKPAAAKRPRERDMVPV